MSFADVIFIQGIVAHSGLLALAGLLFLAFAVAFVVYGARKHNL